MPRAQVGQGFAERLVEDGWFQNVRPGPAQLPEQRPRGNSFFGINHFNSIKWDSKYERPNTGFT